MTKSFKSQMAKIEKDIADSAEKTIRASSISLLSAIVLATPVGNPELWNGYGGKNYRGGSLRGNWQVGLGSAPTSTVAGEDSAGSATIEKSTGIINNFNFGDRSLWFSNNLPYADAVERGHSTQVEPYAMVRTNVQNFSKVMDKVAKVNKI